ncbi:type 1 glutamine amidotransferase domain-containing protein [Staphylococcus condimenti]|uniref:Type 1 glutamine amidotransferase domain-containing protein n=2 Tax=Staphylococcus TaxID=1279 RepID=A0A143PCR3_9STAP|nr:MULTISPECIES: type 1 glutamine amidotransferase domain-containing protein [Staphylococcus]AMY05868.1 protease I [Staphylococcus condimenti]APR59735.1 type 1 glutamine amidotransferase domain-containing protein [Staphylococcus condimenti]MDK8644855.1 type 1 glutamine amidotransferase domain-containing protein [Staphylococcus condimenti]OFP01918.1 protease I [Staphylococcus sp. HMSC065E08]PNZ61610.1 type 1 glutamine amidotransferase domain-containing protein [Staphylococcus condimenti]
MKKIMIVNTSSDHFGENEKPTGLWLGELVHFYDYFNNDNYQIDLFNIEGGNTPIDPVSLKPYTLDKVTKKYYEDEQFMELLKNSPAVSDANPSEYDVIYFTGGHGVMFDFPENQDIQRAIKEIYSNGGIVSAVCHGLAALLNVKDDNGRFLIDHKAITGFSNVEEVLANRKKLVPFMLEDELKKRGANYSKAKLPLRPYVEVDGRLVTGQNPESPKQVAEAVSKIL